MELETIKLIIAIPFVILSAIMICGGAIGLFFASKWQMESKQIIMRSLADYSENMLRTTAVKNYKEEIDNTDSEKQSMDGQKLTKGPN